MTTRTTEISEEWQKKDHEVRKLKDVRVELVGSWLWVSGETYQHRDRLKELGFRWSRKRQKWYWHPGPWKGYGSNKSYEHLKQKHGAQTLKSPEEDEDE